MCPFVTERISLVRNHASSFEGNGSLDRTNINKIKTFLISQIRENKCGHVS